MSDEGVFNTLGGKFEARLRRQEERRRSGGGRENEIVVVSQVALIEVKFHPEVFRVLQKPQFFAVEDIPNQYLIYEVASVVPLHYQMVGMDEKLPRDIRWEMMESISQSWQESSETWINVWAVPTKYRMILNNGRPDFVRDASIPLPGSVVHLLSRSTVESFLSWDDGVEIGQLIGFERPLKVNLEFMIKYHMGAFGFTGSGKSNLLSYLIRLSLRRFTDLKVVVFDVAGEYGIHLLDLLLNEGELYSTENIGRSPEVFLESQAIPETLEEELERRGIRDLREYARMLIDGGRVKRLTTVGFSPPTLRELIDEINESLGTVAALKERQFLSDLINRIGYSDDTPLTSLSGSDREKLIETLRGITKGVSNRSNIYGELISLIDYLSSRQEGSEEGPSSMSSDRLADYIIGGGSRRLTVVYVPDPTDARQVVAKFIERLLYLKKTRGVGTRVLVVLDEAQEFIPDRVTEKDHSDASNRAVEALLRQGRKYRAHCWISTQRLAHLNTNAVQQLHSYFVSTLPRLYDRLVIADAFSLNTDIVERTTDLETGQWLFVSYRATRQKNVPVFIQVPNNETELVNELAKI
ncbi:MAG: ATP-binding protein [Nitrososphaeria archaeon]